MHLKTSHTREPRGQLPTPHTHFGWCPVSGGGSVVVDLLFNELPIVCGVSCLVLVLILQYFLVLQSSCGEREIDRETERDIYIAAIFYFFLIKYIFQKLNLAFFGTCPSVTMETVALFEKLNKVDY